MNPLALDPARLMRALGLTPDPWQAEVLRSTARRLLLLCSRQAGKSTVVAALALHEALYRPDSLILILSRAERQSEELFRKLVRFYHRLGRPVPATRQGKLHLELENGSRVLSLPGCEETVRGYSDPRLIVIDEAARVPQELFGALGSMRVVSAGRLVALSTPFGKRGWFHHEWTQGEGWQRVRIPASQCPRIRPEILEEERRSQGDRFYAQEFECEFVDTDDQLFATHHVDAILDPTLTPLFGPCSPRTHGDTERNTDNKDTADLKEKEFAPSSEPPAPRGLTITRLPPLPVSVPHSVSPCLRGEYRLPAERLFIGLDLGQIHDPTAYAVVDRIAPAGWDPNTATSDRPEGCRYEVLGLCRYPLGTPYPEIVSDVARLHGDLTAVRGSKPSLIADSTGVGGPVVDMFAAAGLSPVAVGITAGMDTVRLDARHWRVPKRELVSVLQVLLHTGRLKVAAGLPEADLLRRELLNFRTRITVDANETFGAWREGEHDDLVIAVALACWAGETIKRRIIRLV